MSNPSENRYSAADLEALLRQASLGEVGRLAHQARLSRTDPSRVTYIKDRNINYTNVCLSGCSFCAFYKEPGHRDGFVITEEEMGAKIEEALELGAVQILLQGGLHPDFGLDKTRKMLRFIKSRFDIHIHGFSPPEIVHLAGLENQSFRKVLENLMEAGLDSMPGGGAEILSEKERSRLSPGKCSGAEWLEVMGTAHRLGMKTTATMMFGQGENLKDRIAHLLAIRKLQDETGGFTAFIPWTFQPGNTALNGHKAVGAHTYLKLLAVSRLALDNIDNLQVSWVTQGDRVAQTALFFGANDFGSTMIEENVVAAAGVSFRLSAEAIENLIRGAGFRPALRNQAYQLL